MHMHGIDVYIWHSPLLYICINMKIAITVASHHRRHHQSSHAAVTMIMAIVVMYALISKFKPQPYHKGANGRRTTRPTCPAHLRLHALLALAAQFKDNLAQLLPGTAQRLSLLHGRPHLPQRKPSCCARSSLR